MASPSSRKIVRCDLHSGHIFRHVCFGKHAVSRRPASIQVHKVFKHCERTVLRGAQAREKRLGQPPAIYTLFDSLSEWTQVIPKLAPERNFGEGTR